MIVLAIGACVSNSLDQPATYQVFFINGRSVGLRRVAAGAPSVSDTSKLLADRDAEHAWAIHDVTRSARDLGDERVLDVLSRGPIDQVVGEERTAPPPLVDLEAAIEQQEARQEVGRVPFRGGRQSIVIRVGAAGVLQVE